VSSALDEVGGLKALYDDFRDAKAIKGMAEEIKAIAKDFKKKLYIMEVCGGHTHVIMRYGLNQLMPDNIEFLHGPGCPVCIMPKERIDRAIHFAEQSDVILVTLGDMIKVPGSKMSLAGARGDGANIRFVYSPTEIIKIARENPSKSVVYFAIGFETTTPMTAAIIDRVLRDGLTNVFFSINHVTVPEPMAAIMDDPETKVNAFLAPAHVSVITGSKIYEWLAAKYGVPIVAGGFEPLDVMGAIKMLALQHRDGRAEVEVEYTRSVSREGNTTAQALIDKYLQKEATFNWRGIGLIPDSSLCLRSEFEHLSAEKKFDGFDLTHKEDNKACKCGDILKGKAKPNDCKVFGNPCTPQNPLGSCMVSSEGACSAYYKYGRLL
jgi:hydrogenase expression/formation protein HypD